MSGLETSPPDAAAHGPAAPPAGIPPEIFQAALTTFLEGRRLDMQALAAELGISRSTLYRRVEDRDALLGEVVWYLTRRAVWTITAQVDREGHLGAARVLEITHRFMAFMSSQTALQSLLEREPEAALRILTSKHGPVQGGLVAATTHVLKEEISRGHMTLSIDPATLAYVMVRIGESFLYADTIADHEPDLELATTVVARLLREPTGDPEADDHS